jgi:hypothetical protein
MFVEVDLKQVKELPKSIPIILVPYRDNAEQERADHLKKFVSHMARYHPDWRVLVIEQSQDERKFNRGALLNIGARIAQRMKIDHIIYHDVDLIPLAPLVPYYTAFPEHPIHVGAVYKDKYYGDGFIGQALSISLKDIKKINGYPNMFWGWGGEDDAMRNRMKKHGMKVLRPDIDKGYKVLEHKDTRTIPEMKNMHKWEDVKSDTGKHGFNDVQWNVEAEEDIAHNAKKVIVTIV